MVGSRNIIKTGEKCLIILIEEISCSTWFVTGILTTVKENESVLYDASAQLRGDYDVVIIDGKCFQFFL